MSEQHQVEPHPPSEGRSPLARASWVLMLLAVAGLVAATLLGAPLVSVLLLGLLLVCPLMLWVPYRLTMRDRDALNHGVRRDG